jgi:hypothetical protein
MSQTPPYYGQRANGRHEWEKMPIFMAFLSAYPLSNRLDNGTTDDRPGIGKGLCVCARHNAIHFAGRGWRAGSVSDRS